VLAASAKRNSDGGNIEIKTSEAKACSSIAASQQRRNISNGNRSSAMAAENSEKHGKHQRRNMSASKAIAKQ